LRTFGSEETFTSPLIEREIALIESETISILEAIFELSGNVFWESVFRAFRLGYLDVPFSPHIANANKLFCKRDANGSIRIADRGNVPINPNDIETEKLLLSSRKTSEFEKSYRQLLIDINIMV